MRLLGLGIRQRGALEFIQNRRERGLVSWEMDFNKRILASLRKRGLVTVEQHPLFDHYNVVKLTAEGRKLAKHWFCQGVMEKP